MEDIFDSAFRILYDTNTSPFMKKKNQRKHFFIDKPLQLRYMTVIAGILLLVSSAVITSLYFGIWGNVLDAFSDEKVRNDLLIASRLTQYEEARKAGPPDQTPLAFFRQAEKLSIRQREVFKEILDRTNQGLLQRLILLLILIAWLTIFLSHKIAGPILHVNKALERLAKGDLRARIKLRKHDEGQSLEEHFNQAASSLDLSIAEIQNIFEEKASDETRQRKLREALAKFKTSSGG